MKKSSCQSILNWFLLHIYFHIITTSILANKNVFHRGQWWSFQFWHAELDCMGLVMNLHQVLHPHSFYAIVNIDFYVDACDLIYYAALCALLLNSLWLFIYTLLMWISVHMLDGFSSGVDLLYICILQWLCSESDGWAAGKLHRRQCFPSARRCSQVHYWYSFLHLHRFEAVSIFPTCICHFQMYCSCSQRPQHLPVWPPAHPEACSLFGGRAHPWCKCKKSLCKVKYRQEIVRKSIVFKGVTDDFSEYQKQPPSPLLGEKSAIT